jgi:hypothetical protein
VFDAVLPLLNNFARVPVCGLIAHYTPIFAAIQLAYPRPNSGWSVPEFLPAFPASAQPDMGYL